VIGLKISISSLLLQLWMEPRSICTKDSKIVTTTLPVGTFEEQYQETISTGYKIILTGHSLGGAEAVIAAVYAAGKLNHAPDAVVTYGAPLTGNQAFVDYYGSVVGCGRALRFTSKGDIIPCIPDAFGYNHI
jgi:predicted lipase